MSSRLTQAAALELGDPLAVQCGPIDYLMSSTSTRPTVRVWAPGMTPGDFYSGMRDVDCGWRCFDLYLLEAGDRPETGAVFVFFRPEAWP